MDEMRQLIGKRYGDLAPNTPKAAVDTPKRATALENSQMEDFARSIEDCIFDADGNLAKAVATQDTLQSEVKVLASALKDVSDATYDSWFETDVYHRKRSSLNDHGLNCRILSGNVNL